MALRAWAALLLAAPFAQVLARSLRQQQLKETPKLCGSGDSEEACLLDSFIVVPEHKLLFCYIDKVACQSFNELFRRLRSRYDPSQAAGRWESRNTPKVHNLTRQDLEGILANDEWHKAVFWRQPLERFASAWASKCRGDGDSDGQQQCQGQFGEESPYPLPFGDTVAFIANHDLVEGLDAPDDKFDRHWRFQQAYCGGLAGTLQHYNTVEELVMESSHEKVSGMLKKVGVEAKSIKGFNELFPDTEAMRAEVWMADSHRTGASDLWKFYPRGEDWRMDTIKRHYWKDRNLFVGNKTARFFKQKLDIHKASLRWPLVDFF